MNVPRRDGARKPFSFSRTKKSNTAATPVKKPSNSGADFFEDMKAKGAATPEGQARTAALDKKLARNSWESNNSRVRQKLDNDAKDKSFADNKEADRIKRKNSSGGTVTAEGGRAIDTGRM